MISRSIQKCARRAWNVTLFVILNCVAISAAAFTSTFPTMSITGDHNDWTPGATQMTLFANNSWEVLLDLETSSEFKFTPHNDWSVSFGVNGGQANIGVNEGVGQYRITFFDDTKRYRIEKYQPPLGDHRVYFKNIGFDTPFIHIWDVQPQGNFSSTPWPGRKMVNEGNGFYRFDFDGEAVDAASVIFNDDGENQTTNLSFNSQNNCYLDGSWVPASSCEFSAPNQPTTSRITPFVEEVWLNNPIQFSGTDSHGGASDIQSFQWSTGDTSESITLTFDQLGETSISLTVTNADGESDTSTLNFNVIPEPKPIELWVKANTAPTIWAWSAESSVSQEMGFTWNNQQVLVVDEDHPGYFYWRLPDEFLDEISSETPLRFKLNGTGYAYTISRSGCLDGVNQWDNAVDGCFSAHDYQPYIGPYLTLISPDLSDNNETVQVLDPTRNMVVNYETELVHTNWVASVQYRQLGQQTWQVARENISGRKIHHIELSNLSPDSTYEYRVISPQNRNGKVYRFETAPLDLNESHFLAIGDMQDPGDDKQRWQDIANAIVANHLDDFRFIITVGDMAMDDISLNGDRFYFWKVFFDKGQQLFARKPIMPTPGNHDTPENTETGDREFSSNAEDTQSYRKYFNLPTDMAFADYYHFDYGNAHFMSVNSEIPVFYGRHPERDTQQRVAKQRAWLETQLNRPEQSTWNFAYWHIPAINPAGGKDEVRFMRPLTDLFHTKLDWAITGHVHENQRVNPTIADTHSLNQVTNYGRLPIEGVGYFVCPPAGQWPRNNSSHEMDLLAFYPQHNGEVAYEIGYTIFQATDNTLNLTTYGMGDVNDRNHSSYRDNGSARVIDQLTYSKAIPSNQFDQNFSLIEFRGTQNNWETTPFSLVGNNTWQIDIDVTSNESFFKFFIDGDWHGDNQSDSIAHTDESSNIALGSGVGEYRITINDTNLQYTIDRL